MSEQQPLHPIACQLACLLVEEQLGPLCKEVCDLLLRKETQSLPELSRGTGCSRFELHQALLVLIQHNCVQPYTLVHDEGGSTPAQTVFQPDLRSILYRFRSARCLLHIIDTWGHIDSPATSKIAECIIEGLLENGRLTSDQLCINVAGKLDAGCKNQTPHKSIKRTLCQLISNHYVERAPPADLPMPRVTVHPKALSKRGGMSSSAKAAADQAENVRRLDKVGYGKERYRIPNDLRLDDDSSDCQSASKRQKVNHPSGTVGAELKGAPILWRVSFEEFNRRFRHDACVELIDQAKDGKAAAVAAAILQKTRQFETILKEESSQPTSAGIIKAALEEMKSRDTELPDIPDVAEALRQLEDDDLGLINSAPGGPDGTTYQIDLRFCISLTRLKAMEAIVRQRFGRLGLRIWRVLLLTGQLEQKSIKELALGDQKEVRQLLYGMLKAGFMAVTDIPKTADRAASRTFYTWRVQPESMTEKIGIDTLHAMFNVASRLSVESVLNSELLQQLELENKAIFKTHGQQLGRLKVVRDLLESSLLRLDDTSALFNDF
ncbi:hypothetical protein WJX84_000731 [Apatococcus fuscideae]|uniref:DNA-directed RNA polymerase III subunit RPC3 n=1 Tax=Apatococcus fuscideae TaxID=2026836 RepID=A0AAW1T7I3_9CHLO